MHDTEDPTRSSAADAAGMAADYSARHTYARGYDDGRAAEKARADALEQRVCELRDVLHGHHKCGCGHPFCNRCRDDAEVAAALASTADIAGRWCPAAERDAAIARSEALDRSISEVECALVLAERARDEVGIQYAAAQAEIARMRPVVDAARKICTTWFRGATLGERDRAHVDLEGALRALDTVPGDALAKVGTMNGASVYVDPTLPEGYVRRVPPAPIKVGDRVRILRESTPAYGRVGEEGTVLAVDPPDETGVYGVQVSGVGKPNRVWWHTSERLAVVPPSPAGALAPDNVKGGE